MTLIRDFLDKLKSIADKVISFLFPEKPEVEEKPETREVEEFDIKEWREKIEREIEEWKKETIKQIEEEFKRISEKIRKETREEMELVYKEAIEEFKKSMEEVAEEIKEKFEEWLKEEIQTYIYDVTAAINYVYHSSYRSFKVYYTVYSPHKDLKDDEEVLSVIRQNTINRLESFLQYPFEEWWFTPVVNIDYEVTAKLPEPIDEEIDRVFEYDWEDEEV